MYMYRRRQESERTLRRNYLATIYLIQQSDRYDMDNFSRPITCVGNSKVKDPFTCIGQGHLILTYLYRDKYVLVT